MLRALFAMLEVRQNNLRVFRVSGYAVLPYYLFTFYSTLFVGLVVHSGIQENLLN